MEVITKEFKNHVLRLRAINARDRLYKANILNSGGRITSYLKGAYEVYNTAQGAEYLSNTLNNRRADETITNHIEEAVNEILK